MWKSLPSTEDGLTNLRFGPSDLVAVSSWDSKVAVIREDRSVASRVSFRAPVLGVAWSSSPNRLYCGGLELHPSVIDVDANVVWDIGGDHREAISSVVASDDVVITGSFDGSIQMVDPRRESGLFYSLPEKVLTMDLVGHNLVVGMTDRLVQVMDTRKLSQAVDKRQLYYNHPLRRVRMFPDGTGYAVSSVTSRVTMHFLNNGRQDYTFRAHRHRDSNGDWTAYSVNALAFVPSSTTLISGGSDRCVQTWDYQRMQLMGQTTGLPYSVQDLDVNSDGTKVVAGLADSGFYTDPKQAVDKIASQVLIREL